MLKKKMLTKKDVREMYTIDNKVQKGSKKSLPFHECDRCKQYTQYSLHYLEKEKICDDCFYEDAGLLNDE